jgi:hypothetical protein
MPSELAQRSLGDLWLHNHALPRRGKLTDGEVGPGKVNKQGETSIGLTWG